MRFMRRSSQGWSSRRHRGQPYEDGVFTAAVELVSATTRGMPQGMVVVDSAPSFSDDGQRLILSTGAPPAAPADPLLAFPKAWTPGTNGPVSGEGVVITQDGELHTRHGRVLIGISLVEDGDHILAVCDAHGRLLWVEGHPATLRGAESMNFVPGARWDEAHALFDRVALDEEFEEFLTLPAYEYLD